MSTSVTCQTAEYPMRLRADGSYERASDSGRWLLARGDITFSYQRNGVPASNVIKAVRLPNDRLMIGNVIMLRCSRNPYAPLS